MILISPDKFKGTYSAAEICTLIEKQLRDAGYRGAIVGRPMSDGGEGVADVLMPGAKKIAQGVYAPTDGSDSRLVVSSELVGFPAFDGTGLPLSQRSSIALGEAIEPGIDTTVAIGGTAVADGGAGFLQGLGAKFFDAEGQLIEEPLCPETIGRIASTDLSALKRFHLSGVVDVKAQLLGGTLSALDFIAQKALPGEDTSIVTSALAHLHEVLGGESPWDGAGGGLGYALASVVGAPCRSGAEAAIEAANLPWDEAQLVITGEGHVDHQTVAGGKLVDAIVAEASRRGIPAVVAYGIADEGLPYHEMVQIADSEGWRKIVQKFS